MKCCSTFRQLKLPEEDSIGFDVLAVEAVLILLLLLNHLFRWLTVVRFLLFRVVEHHGFHHYHVVIRFGFGDATVVLRGQSVASCSSLSPGKLLSIVVAADLDVDSTIETVKCAIHTIEVIILRKGKVLPVVIQLLVTFPTLFDLHALPLVVLEVVGDHIETIYF